MSIRTFLFLGLTATFVLWVAVLAGCGEEGSPTAPSPQDVREDDPPLPPTLEVDLASLFFTFEADSTALTLSNAGEDSLRWYASTEREWCRIEEQWGVLAGKESRILPVRAERTGLRTGLFETSLVLETDLGQTVRISVSLRNYNENIFQLDLYPSDAEYDRELDLIVLVGNNPFPSPNSSFLYIIDPWGHTKDRVPLLSVVNCLSVASDGGAVAVGHNRLVSYVDTRSMAVLGEFPLPYNIGEILLADNGWVYAIPSDRGFHDIKCIDLATGSIHDHVGGGLAMDVTGARLHPSGESFYLTKDHGIDKYDIRGGIAENVPLNILGADYGFSSGLWFTDGGNKLILNGGDVFSTPESDSPALRFITTLDLGTYHIDDLGCIDSIPGSGDILGTSKTAWRVFDEDTLELQAVRTLPGFRGGNIILPSQSRWGFCKSTGDSAVFIIEDYTSNRGWATAAVSLEEE
jgi:hypothetical protein